MTTKHLRSGAYLVAGFLTCLAPAVAQSFVTCNTNAGVRPTVRLEGRAELLGDVILDCTGGTAGASISTTLTVSLNTNLTSKIEGGAPEALVLVDEPPAGSQVVGTNLFQATSGIGNQVAFNINFTAPGNANRILRITNLRANASGLGFSATLIPTQIAAFLSTSATSGGSISINQPQQTVGFVQPGMTSRIRTPTDGFSGGLSFPQCTSQNSALVDSPAASGGSVSFNVKFGEGFPTAFKKRNISADPTTPAAQNIPGWYYGTESGFFDPAFSIANGLNTAGRASHGTRLMLRFDNVPAGVVLYVTTAPSTSGTSAGIGPNGARLVQTDAEGVGSYTPTPATTTALLNGIPLAIAPVTLAGGTGIAVWEILSSDPNVTESVSFGIVAAYNSNAAGFGSITMSPTFAPTSSVTTNASTTVPRFDPFASVPPNYFAISQCGVPLPDLFVSSLSTPAAAVAGSAMAFTSAIQNQGAGSIASTSAAVSLYTDAALTTRVTSVATATCPITPLASSASAPCNGNLYIPASVTIGTYYVGIVIDDQGAIPESNELNNTYALPIAITLGAPSVVSGTPTTTSSTTQTFTFTGRDADGYGDIYRMYFLVNPTPNIPANSCHGFYDRASNGLYLYNDALTAISGPLTPGTSGTLQNSQCVLNGSTSSLVSASGTDLTINLGLGLQGAYAGTNQKVYLWVKDAQGNDTGWVQTGTWNLVLANQPPLVVSGTPTNTSATPQTFTFTGRDPDGFADIYRMYFLINPTPSIPANSCHGFYDRAANGLYLYNDALTAVSGPLTPGTPGTLQNSQCVLNGSTSSLVSASGTDLTINLGLGLQGAYAGTSQKAYLWVKDTQNHDTGWVQTSTWNLTIVNQPPTVFPGVPTFSTINPQTFFLTGKDPDGYGDIYRMYFLVNPTPDIPANSCHGFYDRASNAFYLYNDTLTALLGPLTARSAGTLQNSQCVVNGNASFLVSASGTDLTISLGLALQGSYTGSSQKLYLWVKDTQNHDTGWVQASTWNLTPAANTPPSVVSGPLVIATSNPQTFTFTARDDDGFADIYRMYFLVNPTPDIPANSCHGFYDRATNGLYLYNDTLTAISGPLTPGSAGTLQNSQCVINGSTSYATAMLPLTNLMLAIGVQLHGSYAGTNQKVYVWVKDSQNHDTGWVQTASWNLAPAANQAPTVVSGTPASSTVTPQTFTFTGRDPDGYADIYRMYFLVNPTPNIPANSCHGFYDRASNALYLYNDTLTAVSGPLTPGTAGTLQNSQCVLNGSTSSLVSASGTDLTINLGLGLQGAYAGTNQKVYLWVKDNQNHDTGWVQTGVWNLH
jgi:hypothetical protein